MTRRTLLLALGAAVAVAQTPAPPAPDKERWNKIFTSAESNFNRKPNAFLTGAVKGRKPGKALDIGMGQGRNSIYLAQQGWDVTGVDISEEGIRVAQETAAKLGVKINPVLKSVDEFDFGREQWDLVAGIFMHQFVSRHADKIHAALKPGGIVVVEGFHEDRGKTGGRPFGYKTNELLRAFDGLRIVHYEDRIGPADWAGGADMPIVRFIARKE
jgi:SAM-dependent methyltransferase